MNKPPERWFVLDSGPCDYAFNMALDEALMEFAPELSRPVLRFYGWTQRAASFGYSQKISELEAITKLRPLVRRTTGGGLVPHDADWTYSVVVPPNHAWYELRASESYERMHRWIQSAFAVLDIATELAPCCRKEIPGQCFVGYEKSDVLRFGSKIAGAAQRRSKHGLLIQGSIQPAPPNLARTQWQQAMIQVAGAEWAGEFTTLEISPALQARAEQLAREQFSRDEHNRRR
jgi:lipoyl(octanoyl) transferase